MTTKNKTRHSTLIGGAVRVARILRRAGLPPHPGPIDPKGGRGAVRVKISAEPGRTRIRVAGGGVQDLYLYGPVSLDRIAAILGDALGPSAVERISWGEPSPHAESSP